MINNIINNKKDNNYSPRAALLLTSYTFLVSTSCIFDEWILFTNSQEVHFTEKMLAKPIIDSDIVSVKFNSFCRIFYNLHAVVELLLLLPQLAFLQFAFSLACRMDLQRWHSFSLAQDILRYHSCQIFRFSFGETS